MRSPPESAAQMDSGVRGGDEQADSEESCIDVHLKEKKEVLDAESDECE